MIRVVLADDHEMVLDGLTSILKAEEQIQVVGTASNGKQALEIIRTTPVDVAVLDISMPEMDGIETTKVIVQEKLPTKILILSMYNKYEFINKLAQVGCSGYILKNKGKEELVQAIMAVHNGQDYFGDAITKTVMDAQRKVEEPKSKKPEPTLTKRELEILKLIAQEYTSPEIASMLFIEIATVNTHRRNLIKKLGLKSSLGIVRYAIKKGLID